MKNGNENLIKYIKKFNISEINFSKKSKILNTYISKSHTWVI